jgi:hypothetical protein
VGVAGWAGCIARKRRKRPKALGCSLPIKTNKFELGFEKEFEFDSLSNSNFTQLNSK